MYHPTAYIYPTRSATYADEIMRNSVPGRVDLVLAYPSSTRKNGEMTFTFEGRTAKQVRKVVALLRHTQRGLIIGDEQTANFLA